MKVLDRVQLAFLALVALPFLVPPYVPLEPAWDLSAGFGYAALAAAALAGSLGWRHRVPGRPLAIPLEIRVHRWVGHAVWILTLLHVATMLALDPVILEYVTWTMPLHVVLGFVATALLVVTVLSKEPLRRPWLGRGGNARLHMVAAPLFAALALLHTVLSQSKLLAAWQALLPVLVLALAILPSAAVEIGLFVKRRRGRPHGHMRRVNVTRFERARRVHMLPIFAAIGLVLACATLWARLGLALWVRSHGG